MRGALGRLFRLVRELVLSARRPWRRVMSGKELEQTLSLIRRARSGDAEAAEHLFSRYGEVALRTARRFIGPSLARRVDPGDVAQSALVGVWRNFQNFKYEGQGSLDRYVRRAVLNKIRDELDSIRARPREVSLDSSGSSRSGRSRAGVASLVRAQATSVRSEAIRREDQARVRRAISLLPPAYAEAVRLFVLEGRNYAEVAGRLGLPSAEAARMRIDRGKRALAGLLATPKKD